MADAVVDRLEVIDIDREKRDVPSGPGASLLRAPGVGPTREVRDNFLRAVPLSEGRVRPALFGA